MNVDEKFKAYESTFRLPTCDNCGSTAQSLTASPLASQAPTIGAANTTASILKPNVVMFGDNVPPRVTQEVNTVLSEADGVLCVGTSLSVWSAFRIVRLAAEGARPIPVAMVNRGPTRGDELFQLNIHGACGEVLSQVFQDG